MRVIQACGIVTAEGELVVRTRLPDAQVPGERRVVLVVEDPGTPQEEPPALSLPVLEVDSWPPHLSLRREAMYGDWGR